MAEVNMKSTKQELYDAYLATKKELDARAAMKEDPVATQEAKRRAAVLVSAEKVAELEILAPEVVQQYKDLCEAVDMKKKDIKELYDIEVEANSLVSLINAHRDKEQELKDKFKKMNDDMLAEFNEKKADANAEIDRLNEKMQEVLKETRQQNDALKAALIQEREREEEEYAYATKRARKIADDKWADEKTTREKALAEKEASVAETEANLAAKEEKIEELERRVAEIPTLIETATEAGKKAGKADADKSNAFEVRYLKQENEYAQKALKDQVARLEADLEAAKDKNDILQDKLDAAYAQMRELAAETVKSTGGVKIIGNESNNK